ncbi:MAG: MMPL family transporter [Clostridia bacterium]|nr:MMPL family transporter [Clostridia bacterium]
MEKLSEFIVKHRHKIGIVFIILIFLAVIGMINSKINYDLTKYVPDDMPSKVALDLSTKEFGMQGTARLMLNNVTLVEAKEYKEKIINIDGVYRVMWLDDKYDVYQPIEFIDKEELEKYYKDGCALFDIMFEEDDYSNVTNEAVGKIQKLIPEDACFIGAAVDNKSTRDNIQSEMVVIMAFLIPLTLIVLLLTTDSYFSSVVFITVISVSILLNLGTNIIFESVSFITFSISAALQFAVSMDYSVFMLHQFETEKQRFPDDNETAMKKAVKHSISSVFSSSLTTVAGFIALAFMSFGIGKDIGFVFAKGIVFSLLCVIFLMPYLILTFNKLIEKTKHKRILPSFDRFSRATLKVGPFLIIAALIIIVPSYVAQKNNNFLYGASSFSGGPGTKIYEDEPKIIEKFGRSNPILLIVPNKDYYTEKQLVEEIEDVRAVDKILTLVNEVPEGVPYDFVDRETYSKFQNEKYTRILVYVKTSSESELATSTLKEITDITSKYYGNDYYYTGTIPVTLDMQKSIEKDYNIVNWISIIAIIIILIFTFKSFVTPILLTLVIEAGIFINMAIPFYADESLIFIGYLIVSSIELGATIDYAILLTNNYIKFRKHYNKKMAAATAIKESLSSIITSGAILIIAGYILKFVSSLKAVSDMGELIGRGALISVILVVAVLPQLLSMFDFLVTRKVETFEKKQLGDSSDGKQNKSNKKKDRIKDKKYKKNRIISYFEWRKRNKELLIVKLIEDRKKQRQNEQISMFEDEKKGEDDNENK